MSNYVAKIRRPLKVAMVAGEASGDFLGAGLIKEIKRHHHDAYCYGIGGALMQDEGFDSLFPLERLSVMGFVAVLGRLKELISIRCRLKRRFIDDQPDVFIGIDAPDFNLGLELQLKSAGIPIVHYVSPQVWAWREGRLKKIKRSVDHMLALLPFEEGYYKDHGVDVTFVGHPLADKVALTSDKNAARLSLGITESGTVIAILPGSRKAEIAKLGKIFLTTARLLSKEIPNVRFIVPCVNEKRKRQLIELLKDFNDLNLTLYDGSVSEVMAASDAMLITSGTATLEAALYKRPFVVSYRAGSITFAIVKKMVKVKYVALPNLLAGKELVPELLQKDATPEKLCAAMLKSIRDKAYQAELEQEFMAMHLQLKRNASELAYGAIKSVMKERRLEHATTLT
ncbi:MAG: lipid-A-disaccharide synthase [Candidatus Endonucleobacter bathymodioli]|uniref:Lipid-A-disaccharide synthase n=1 Tax=Candidatus Endonucleibacter bathymodioli TaxID=539814 RepID=A0AA90P2C9_9GAMM|nr:lipid-A-disaccharide synthase [Candidatus Endonucleobacter bathymodioli]